LPSAFDNIAAEASFADWQSAFGNVLFENRSEDYGKNTDY